MGMCKICGKPLNDPNETVGPECKTKTKKSKDYKFARESVISNQGEDIQDSARHRYHEWLGLEKAELAGEEVARREVTRDKLLKNAPASIVVSKDNIIGATIATTILKRMPAEPAYINDPNLKYEYFALCSKNKNGKENIIVTSHRKPWLESQIRAPGREYVRPLGNSVEANKALRENYFNKYEFLKNEAEMMAANEKLFGIHEISDESERLAKIDLEMVDFKNRFSEEYGVLAGKNMSGSLHFALSEEDAGYLGRYFGSLKYRNTAKKYSLKDVLANTFRSIAEGDTDSIVDSLKKANSGGSLGIGAPKGIKGERFNPIIFYSQKLERTGPEIAENSVMDYTDTISKKWKIRGVQFGNTMTDPERIEHLAKFTESMYDLKDVLNLSDEDISFNGKLAIAFGARGRSSALAHFEHNENAINLTRKKGIGALAHEWGHALEHNNYSSNGYDLKSLGAVLKDPEEYFKSRASQKGFVSAENKEAHKQFSIQMKSFVTRMVTSKRFNEFPDKHQEYLTAAPELFARTFEAMVKKKLASKKRSNTYLVSCEDADVYPSNKELEAMEPHFDILIKDLFGKSKSTNKAA